MTDFREITYVVDAQDRLVAVSPEWSDFAVHNDGAELSPEQVKGRSLWEFIADETTQELYRAVLARVRTGPPADLVLRCDAPERRRLIEMEVTPQPEGQVAFKTVLLAAKDRPEQRLLNRTTPRTQQHVMVCSWCDRVSVGRDEWLEVEPAMERLGLDGAEELPRVEPVVCAQCYAKVMEILAQANPLVEP
jgi:hypothetical protein